MCHLAFFFLEELHQYDKPKDTIRSFFFFSSLEHGHEFVGRQRLNRTTAERWKPPSIYLFIYWIEP
ncbi:hypothetical protein ACSS6W_009695 [Trichoderma asperelloides]